MLKDENFVKSIVFAVHTHHGVCKTIKYSSAQVLGPWCMCTVIYVCL